MKNFVAFFVIITFGCCLCDDCPVVPKHYEELGCVPLIKEGEKCAYSYDCSPFEHRDKNKCYFGGKTYEIQQEIDNDLTSGSCTVGCRCNPGYDNKIKFTCAHIDCPEFFGGGGGLVSLTSHCIYQYKKNRCCRSGTVCDENLKKLERCELNGNSYYEGERMESGKSCYSCICEKGFDPNVPIEENKSCWKINCMIDLHYGNKISEGCVPVYYGEERCCPIPEFRCPDSNTTVVKSLGRTSEAKTNDECKFGNLRLGVGDVLSPKGNKCVTCSCKVPPYVTCVQKRDC